MWWICTYARGLHPVHVLGQLAAHHLVIVGCSSLLYIYMLLCYMIIIIIIYASWAIVRLVVSPATGSNSGNTEKQTGMHS